MSSMENELYFGDPGQILERLDAGDCAGKPVLLEAAVAGLARNLVRIDAGPNRFDELSGVMQALKRGRQLSDRSATGILIMVVEGIAHARAEVQAQRWTIGQKDAFINGLELTARKFLEAQ